MVCLVSVLSRGMYEFIHGGAYPYKTVLIPLTSVFMEVLIVKTSDLILSHTFQLLVTIVRLKMFSSYKKLRQGNLRLSSVYRLSSQNPNSGC
jgi:hypothetical protein